MADSREGLSAWRQHSNHNRMMRFQSGPGLRAGSGVKVDYFGHSAFRMTSPSGLSVMIDPWRNSPRGGQFFFHDFPLTPVDVGVCTHAHFDHDALHRLDAHVLIDRLIGTYEFADLRITGLADKHAIDFSSSTYDIGRLLKELDGVEIAPPDNPRSWDNCLILVETGGLRILHWGDNRADLSEEVWARLGRVDVLLMPIDDSRHVISFEAVDRIVERLRPAAVIPSHYYIWNITMRQSTLFGVDEWLATQRRVVRLDHSGITLPANIADEADPTVYFFGEHVAFDVAAWHRDGGS